MKYLMPELRGTLELVKRRKVHTDGRDKIIMVYRYECGSCDFNIVQAGLAKIRRSADIHFTGVHSNTTSKKVIEMLSQVQQNPPQSADEPPY